MSAPPSAQNARAPHAKSHPNSSLAPLAPWRSKPLHLLHRSADILSATVRATSCRPNSKDQTADSMSTCQQRAECTRSAGQIPSQLFLGDLSAFAVQTSSSSPRSADILSATVRATSCRPNSKEQTADRMSACQQRAECTRSARQIPSPTLPWRTWRLGGPNLFIFPPERRYPIGYRARDILSPEFPKADCGQNVRLPTARRMHALLRPNPLPPLFLGDLSALAVQTSSSSPRSADILSATVRATSCRPNSKEQTADSMSACRQRAACTRSTGQIPSQLFLGDLAVQTFSSSPKPKLFLRDPPLYPIKPKRSGRAL
jgi:hypothetical protein